MKNGKGMAHNKMNVLFLTLVDIRSPEERNIYMDLMRTFAAHGQNVFIVSPLEKKYRKNTKLIRQGNIQLLKVRTGNLFQVGMVEKAISQLQLDRQYWNAVQQYFGKQAFDLILYSTPPITLAGAVKKVKKRTGASTYLLLKDIFPQNAVDIGLMKKWMAELFFRRKEKMLYDISDHIGCMSPANKEYLLAHNRLNKKKVELCPNSILPEPYQPEWNRQKGQKRKKFCEKLGIPEETVLFLYGGNLGKPQDIPYIIRCIEAAAHEKWAYFIICGTGTELGVLEKYAASKKPENLKVIPGLPKEKYEKMAAFCDVGMLFLDYRFTIPNFPSRLLSYLEKGIPVLACTDRSTDVGEIAEKNRFGKACLSNEPIAFVRTICEFKEEEVRLEMGNKGRKFLEEHYTVQESYRIIMKHISD